MKNLFFLVTCLTVTLAATVPGYKSTHQHSIKDNGANTYKPSYTDCDCPENALDVHLYDCTEKPCGTHYARISFSGGNRIIETNSIPDHFAGYYPIPNDASGNSPNPNAIIEQEPHLTFKVTGTPLKAATDRYLLWTSGPDKNKPRYIFGITLTGIELDPFPILWWNVATGKPDSNIPSDWIYEPLQCKGILGIDCHDAHPDGDGIYHYHWVPYMTFNKEEDHTPDIIRLNLEINTLKYRMGNNIVFEKGKMTLCGYAADGFPIYYKNGYKTSLKKTRELVTLKSSWRLKSGCRADDPDFAGDAVPCGNYNGKFTLDYEYVAGLGDLDKCNGITGWTPEFGETYYYVITDEFPVIPRYFKGTPSEDFSVAK
jgi:hypothetical protein